MNEKYIFIGEDLFSYLQIEKGSYRLEKKIPNGAVVIVNRGRYKQLIEESFVASTCGQQGMENSTFERFLDHIDGLLFYIFIAGLVHMFAWVLLHRMYPFINASFTMLVLVKAYNSFYFVFYLWQLVVLC